MSSRKGPIELKIQTILTPVEHELLGSGIKATPSKRNKSHNNPTRPINLGDKSTEEDIAEVNTAREKRACIDWPTALIMVEGLDREMGIPQMGLSELDAKTGRIKRLPWLYGFKKGGVVVEADRGYHFKPEYMEDLLKEFPELTEMAQELAGETAEGGRELSKA